MSRWRCAGRRAARGSTRRLVAGLVVGLLTVRLWAEDVQKVTFGAADGFCLHADYYAPKGGGGEAPMVMLLHLEKGERSAWAPLIEPLREAGFAILAPDLRGHGESATSDTRERLGKDDPQLFRDFQKDLRGAYDWLAKQTGVDRARFAIVGAGAMAAVAFNYAVADRSVDVLVCLSPGLKYPGLDPSGDLGQLTGRKLLFLASRDERDACDYLAGRTTGVEKRLLEGSARGTDLLGATPKIDKEIVDFLTRGVGKPAKTVVYGSIRSNIYHPPDSRWLKEIDPSNLRYYSSPQEAEARGLRAAKSRGPRESSGEREKGAERGRGRERPRPNP